MIVQIVRFKTELSFDDVLKKSNERADRYRATKGLLQKYYLKYQSHDEYGAVYLWESEDDMKNFLASDLARTIPEAYQVQGKADIQMGEVAMVLREG